MAGGEEPFGEIRPPEPIRQHFDSSSPEKGEWWRVDMSQNKLITDWYDQRPMTPPPTEPRALSEWVGQNALTTAKEIQSNPEKHGKWENSPHLAAKFLYCYAEAIADWHSADARGDRETSLVQAGRVEQLQEVLGEMGVTDTSFVENAFKHIPGFHYPRLRNA